MFLFVRFEISAAVYILDMCWLSPTLSARLHCRTLIGTELLRSLCELIALCCAVLAVLLYRQWMPSVCMLALSHCVLYVLAFLYLVDIRTSAIDYIVRWQKKHNVYEYRKSIISSLTVHCFCTEQ